MAVFTLNPKYLNSNQMIFYQLLLMLPAIVFYAQAIFQIGNTYSVPVFNVYRLFWYLCLEVSLIIGYKVLAKPNAQHSLKLFSTFLVIFAVYILVINFNVPYYLLKEFLFAHFIIFILFKLIKREPSNAKLT